MNREEAEQLAKDAIGLFIEYRDKHGVNEFEAQARAVNECGEGAEETPPVGQWRYDPGWRYFVLDGVLDGEAGQTIVGRETIASRLSWTGMTLEELGRAVLNPMPGAYTSDAIPPFREASS